MWKTLQLILFVAFFVENATPPQLVSDGLKQVPRDEYALQEIEDPKWLTDEERVETAKLIIVAEFRYQLNERRAESEVIEVEVLAGTRKEKRQMIICFRTTELTVFPQKGSKWIFFLGDAFDTTDTEEYRRVIGSGIDKDGIVPATDSEFTKFKKLISKKKQKTN